MLYLIPVLTKNFHNCRYQYLDIMKYPDDFYLHTGFIFFLGRVAQSVGQLTRKSGVLGSISGLATYFRFSFR